MLIVQTQFWLVLWPLLMLASFLLARAALEIRQWFWIAASLGLYAIADLGGMPLLLVSLLFNGLIVAYLLGEGKRRRVVITLSILMNVGWMLIPAFRSDGNSTGSLFSHLALSFLSLRQIWLLRDVHQLQVKSLTARSYLLFMLFFPHLLMGPLARISDLQKQFDSDDFARLSLSRINPALILIACGLFKKLIIADTLAGPVISAMIIVGDGNALSFMEAWSLLLGFQLQLYFDFSAYSDIAIGLALMLGVNLPLNFFSPFRAFDRLDVWRRWHLGFVAFLKYNLFLPLRRYFPVPVLVAIVGFASGMWHGVSLNFMLWSAAQSLLLLVSHERRRLLRRFDIPYEGKGFRRVMQSFWVISISSFVGVFFLSADMHQSIAIMHNALMPDTLGIPAHWLSKLGFSHWAQATETTRSLMPVWLMMLLPILFIWVLFLPNAAQLLREHVKFLTLERDTELLLKQTPPSPWLLKLPPAFWSVMSAIIIVYSLWLSDSAARFIYMRF